MQPSPQAPQKNFIESPENVSVLIADDDRLICRLIIAILQDSGIYNVHSAADGQEAFDLLKERTFDLALLDIHMPGLNGIALSAQIRALDRLHRRRTGIIIMTTHCDAKLVQFVKANEVDQLCLKPLERTKLVHRISAALASRSQSHRDASVDANANTVWV